MIQLEIIYWEIEADIFASYACKSWKSENYTGEFIYKAPVFAVWHSEYISVFLLVKPLDLFMLMLWK